MRCTCGGGGPLAAVVFGKAIDKGQRGSRIVGQFLLSGGIGRLRLRNVAVTGKCVLEGVDAAMMNSEAMIHLILVLGANVGAGEI